MDYNELKKRVHKMAVTHENKDCNIDNCLMRVIVEVGNAVQAHDKNFRVEKNFISRHKDTLVYDELFFNGVRETVEDYFANIVIRLIEFADKKEIPFDYITDYEDRFEHLSFSEAAYRFVATCLTNYWVYPSAMLADTLHYMEQWAKYLDIDLGWFVRVKLDYSVRKSLNQEHQKDKKFIDNLIRQIWSACRIVHPTPQLCAYGDWAYLWLPCERTDAHANIREEGNYNTAINKLSEAELNAIQEFVSRHVFFDIDEAKEHLVELFDDVSVLEKIE